MVSSVEEGVLLAEEVWESTADPLSYKPSRALRALVRQTLYAEVVAVRLKEQSPLVTEWYAERLQNLTKAAEALAHCYVEGLIAPEGEKIALSALGMLEAHETAVIDEAIGARFSVVQSTRSTAAS